MNILTINATEQNGTISISGTADTGMLAAAISVYDKTGTNLLALETTAVENGSFSHTITMASGEYLIKVADYDGGDYMSTTVAETAASEETTAGSPETGFQTITKTPDTAVEPSTNASSSVTIFAGIAAVIAAAAIFVVVFRAVKRHRQSK